MQRNPDCTGRFNDRVKLASSPMAAISDRVDVPLWQLSETTTMRVPSRNFEKAANTSSSMNSDHRGTTSRPFRHPHRR